MSDLTVVGTLDSTADGTIVEETNVVANSPGDVTLNGDNARLSSVNVEKNINVNGNNADISDSSAGEQLTVAAGTTGTSLQNSQANTFDIQGDTETQSGLSSTTVEVDTADKLRAAATDDLANTPVGSQTTIVVNETVDLSTGVDVTVDGVTIEGAQDNTYVNLTGDSTGQEVFEILADDVTLQDISAERTGDGSAPGPGAQAVTVRDASGVTISNVDVTAGPGVGSGIAVLDGGAVDGAGVATDITIVDSSVSATDGTGPISGINVAAAFGGEVDAVTVEDNDIEAASNGLVVSTTSLGLSASEPGTFGAEGVTVTDNRDDDLLARDEVGWDVLVWTPDERAYSADADVERCADVAPMAELVADLALDGRYAAAMTVNGLAFSAALGFSPDPAVEAMPHVAGVSLSGTGPSVVAVGDADGLDRVHDRWSERSGRTWRTTTRTDGARIL